jgi:hypothetical protein
MREQHRRLVQRVGHAVAALVAAQGKVERLVPSSLPGKEPE